MKRSIKFKERLRSGADIRRALSKGRRVYTSPFGLCFSPNGLGHSRFTVITSRKVGISVARNRVKRLIRETIRLNKERFSAGFDIIIRPFDLSRLRPGANYKYMKYCEVEPAILFLFRKAGILKGKN